MKRLLLALPVLALTATAGLADPYADRTAIMKGFGEALKTLVPVAKGEAPFDAATVAAALGKVDEGARKIDVAALFPAGSNTGDSTASPKIWENMADFTAKVDKFKADAAAAAAANPADLQTFNGVFGGLAGNCAGCHEAYRIKKG